MEDSQLIPHCIATQAPQIDPAFATPSKYDKQRALFEPKQPAHELERALARYQELGCTPRLGFDSQKLSWDDVEDKLADVQAAYENKASGVKGIFHKVIRKMGDNADSITPTLQLLPDQYGLAIVKGALGWMFLLMKETAKRRGAILAAFKDVPGTIQAAEARRRHFPDDVLLNDLADKLNDTLLDALSKMVRFLLPKHQLVKVFPVFPDAPSGPQIDDALKNIEAAVAALRRRAEFLVEGTVMQTQKMVEKDIRETQATRLNTVLTLQATRNVGQQVAALPGEIHDLKKSVEDIRADVQRLEREAMHTLAQAGIEAQNSMRPLLEDLVRGFQACMLFEIERARTPCLGNSTAPPLLTASQLLHLLDVSPESLTHDLTAVVREGLHLDSAAQLQAQSLLKMDRFWQWFSSASSDLLLVSTGHLADSPQLAGRISPLSVLCASIIGCLVKTQDRNVLPLYFFCGHHVAATRDGGPQAMMRSLVARLLLAAQAGGNGSSAALLDFISEAASVKALARHDVTELCRVFYNLISRFPRRITIYCILDGISWYERLEMLEGLFHIVQMLAQLVDDPYLRPVLKVFLTCPFLSRRIAPELPVHQRLILRSTLALTGILPDRMLMAGFMSRVSPGMRAEGVSVSMYRPPKPTEYDEGTAEDYR